MCVKGKISHVWHTKDSRVCKKRGKQAPFCCSIQKHQNIILEDSEKALAVYMSEMTYIETSSKATINALSCHEERRKLSTKETHAHSH